MTLVLSNSIRIQGSMPDGTEVEIKSHGSDSSTNYREKDPPEPEVRIGDCYMSSEDFCEAIRYFLTNTDLEEQDPRLELLQDLSTRTIQVPGYNKDAVRLQIDQ